MKKAVLFSSALALFAVGSVFASDCDDLQYANGQYLKEAGNPVLYYPDGSILGNSDYIRYPNRYQGKNGVMKDGSDIYYPDGRSFAKAKSGNGWGYDFPELYYPLARQESRQRVLQKNGDFFDRKGNRVGSTSDYDKFSLHTDLNSNYYSYGVLELQNTSEGDYWILRNGQLPWIKVLNQIRKGGSTHVTKIELTRMVLDTGRVIFQLEDTYQDWGNGRDRGWRTIINTVFNPLGGNGYNGGFEFTCKTVRGIKKP